MSNLVKRYGKRALDTAKTIGKFGVAVVTEPFTNKILKKNNAIIDSRNKEAVAVTKERSADLKNRSFKAKTSVIKKPKNFLKRYPHTGASGRY